MPLLKRSILGGSERQCGPTLIITMACAVLALFTLIFVFNHRNSQTRPQVDRSAPTSNLPTQ